MHRDARLEPTYVEFVTDERLETLVGCHERAFYFFSGVPREVLYDNTRTVVNDRDQYGPGLQAGLLGKTAKR